MDISCKYNCIRVNEEVDDKKEHEIKTTWVSRTDKTMCVCRKNRTGKMRVDTNYNDKRDITIDIVSGNSTIELYYKYRSGCYSDDGYNSKVEVWTRNDCDTKVEESLRTS